MTSPHPNYPHQGPGSYYQHSPPSHPIYGNHSPGPGHSPNPYQYMYPSHPPPPHMNSHPSSLHHQPTSGRMNGRGGSYTNRNGHGHPHMYHQNFHPPPQHQTYPHPLALHAPHPQHPHPQHPAKFAHPYTPPYPYPSPTSAGPYSPSWQAQQPLSPLPKQLSMPPPRGISPAYYEPPPAPPPQMQPPAAVVPEQPAEIVAESAVTPAHEPITTQAEQVMEPSTPAPVVPQDKAAEETVKEPSSAATQVPEGSEATDSVPSSSVQVPSSTYTTMGSITNSTIMDSNVPPSPVQSVSSSNSRKVSVPNHTPSFAIWSRRPGDPSKAPGIIISPRARPPSEIVQQALNLQTPPASPKVVPVSLPEEIIPETPAEEKVFENPPDSPVQERDASVSSAPESSQLNSTISSSSVTETSEASTLPGSPISTNTSMSIVGTPSKDTMKTPAVEVEAAEAEASITASIATTPVASTSKTPEPEAKPVAPKTWASLFASSSSRSSLPTSSVVGFSIPAASASLTPAIPVAPSKKPELLSLLTTGPSATSGGLPKIKTRGLINSGNMCFANAVLQVLVYCQPFQKLFTDLGKLLGKEDEKKAESKGNKSNTPFIDATVEFLKEFMEEERKKKEGLEKKVGKGKEKEIEPEEEEDEWSESFLPSYVYDAMKEKKRFESMRGGQQEDAEEFLGFYLDTLEEELLYIQHSLAPPPKSAAATKQVEEKEEAEPPEEDGWLEVGKRNRMVVTRTIKAVESPITRIFGGKFKSTLKAPGQKDSVLVEDWRSLRLDIQRETIHNIQDALLHITHPQAVQVTHSSRPGVTVDASQKVVVESLPPILVLHMKRFCYDTTVGGVVKVTKQVQFGPELEIGADMMAPTGRRAQPAKYRLFGALYHHGHSASGGHYTLDVLHPNRYPGAKLKEGWVRIDDELVSDVRPEDVFNAWEKDETRNAYLLFYKRIR